MHHFLGQHLYYLQSAIHSFYCGNDKQAEASSSWDLFTMAQTLAIAITVAVAFEGRVEGPLNLLP